MEASGAAGIASRSAGRETRRRIGKRVRIPRDSVTVCGDAPSDATGETWEGGDAGRAVSQETCRSARYTERAAPRITEF